VMLFTTAPSATLPPDPAALSFVIIAQHIDRTRIAVDHTIARPLLDTQHERKFL
jgi:hypothetical protein